MYMMSVLPVQDEDDVVVAHGDIPAPSEDVRKYTRELDLAEIFNHHIQCASSIQPRRSVVLFRDLSTDSPAESLEALIGSFPETSGEFWADHALELESHAETCRTLKKLAEAAGRPFEPLAPPYAPNHCRIEFAKHVLAAGRALLDNEPGFLNLSVLLPHVEARTDVPAAILHQDEAGYKLALVAQPS